MSETKNAKREDNASKKNTAASTKQKKKNDLKVAESKKNDLKKVENAKANAKQGEVSSGLNTLLWCVSFALLAAAIGGNYYYTQNIMINESSFERLARVAIVIVTILAGLAVVLFTSKGKQLLSFGRDSYTELRKVVWPTRQEAVQTTFIVFIAVCVVSLFLYVCDLVFLQIVRVITL